MKLLLCLRALINPQSIFGRSQGRLDQRWTSAFSRWFVSCPDRHPVLASASGGHAPSSGVPTLVYCCHAGKPHFTSKVQGSDPCRFLRAARHIWLQPEPLLNLNLIRSST